MISQSPSSTQHMFDIIAASFFQKKSCILPGIGQLTLTNTPAVTDFFNNQILAPGQTINFTEAVSESEPSFNEFSAISELMKNQLETDGEVNITGLGNFKKQPDGHIHFKSFDLDPVFLQPVRAVRVIRTDAEHTVLVGDKETSSTVMTEMLQGEEETVKKDYWWIWALAGFIIAATIIGYYLSQFGFNNLGNSSH